MSRGLEKPGQVQRIVFQANPEDVSEVRSGAKKSSEVTESTLSRKAAIDLYVPVP